MGHSRQPPPADRWEACADVLWFTEAEYRALEALARRHHLTLDDAVALVIVALHDAERQAERATTTH